jgi:IS5 family transposase
MARFSPPCVHKCKVEIIHRGKYRSLTHTQRRWLRRRQAVESTIGHLKAEHRMNRRCRAKPQ